ncbi:VOC family protein [Candidatus Uabimicrobium sp. HlEnr_7]|uniref:VOC family protein n=1 Tax=Candidatus Uabimicrobium helgolandensis TaxID=3095367 RepID=UPI0035586F84
MKSIIQTPTNNLENSIEFYKKLDFKIISGNSSTLVSDGKAFIEINPDRFARAGLKLFKNSWKEEVAQLEKLTHVTHSEKTYILSSPSGTWVYLVEGGAPTNDHLQEKSFGLTGNFQGLSLETTDIKRSVDFWHIFGFAKTMGDIEQGWMSLAGDDGMTISLMKPLCCPHLFFNPSMTYFNGKENMAIIEKIRQIKIPIVEEITHFNKEGIVDNIIIRDPGGFGFFIFSD